MSKSRSTAVAWTASTSGTSTEIPGADGSSPLTIVTWTDGLAGDASVTIQPMSMATSNPSRPVKRSRVSAGRSERMLGTALLAVTGRTSCERRRERRVRDAKLLDLDTEAHVPDRHVERTAAHGAEEVQRRPLAQPLQRLARARHHEAARALAEQVRQGVVRGAEVERRAETTRQAALGHGHEEAALGDVVGARELSLPDGVAHRLLGRADVCRVERLEP